MIEHPNYKIEPWACVRAHSTSTCWRSRSRFSRLPTGISAYVGTSTRVSPTDMPGTYLNAFWEARPLPYAEAGYGYPEAGQTLVNMTNGKIIRLLVDDSPFDIRYGELKATSACSTFAPAYCAAKPSGARRWEKRFASSHNAWSPLPSARSQRYSTKSNRSKGRYGQRCSQSW